MSEYYVMIKGKMVSVGDELSDLQHQINCLCKALGAVPEDTDTDTVLVLGDPVTNDDGSITFPTTTVDAISGDTVDAGGFTIPPPTVDTDTDTTITFGTPTIVDGVITIPTIIVDEITGDETAGDPIVITLPSDSGGDGSLVLSGDGTQRVLTNTNSNGGTDVIEICDISPEITAGESLATNTGGNFALMSLRGENDTGALDTETDNVAQKVFRQVSGDCSKVDTVIVEDYHGHRTYVDNVFGSDDTGMVNRHDKPFETVDAAFNAVRADGLSEANRHTVIIHSGNGVYPVNGNQIFDLGGLTIQIHDAELAMGGSALSQWIFSGYNATDNLATFYVEGFGKATFTGAGRFACSYGAYLSLRNIEMKNEYSAGGNYQPNFVCMSGFSDIAGKPSQIEAHHCRFHNTVTNSRGHQHRFTNCKFHRGYGSLLGSGLISEQEFIGCTFDDQGGTVPTVQSSGLKGLIYSGFSPNNSGVEKFVFNGCRFYAYNPNTMIKAYDINNWEASFTGCTAIMTAPLLSGGNTGTAFRTVELDDNFSTNAPWGANELIFTGAESVEAHAIKVSIVKD